MRITTKKQAFEALKTEQDQMPREAIQFLYDHAPDPDITQQIIAAFKLALNQMENYDRDRHFLKPHPIWYAIVAEAHLSEALLDAIIDVGRSEEELSDLFWEQVVYLVGALCDQYPDLATERFLEAILEAAAKEGTLATHYPLLYFSTCISYCQEKHYPIIRQILSCKEAHFLDTLCGHIAVEGHTALRPEIEVLHTYLEQNYPNRHETSIALEIFNDPTTEAIEEYQVEFKTRKQWQSHYENFENRNQWLFHKISTKEEAFQKIENFDPSLMPREAIRFLYNHAPDPEIQERVVYHIQNAYNEAVNNDEFYGLKATPLWYAIIGEKQHSEALIQPVIDLYRKVDHVNGKDWDFLNEQGMVLVGRLCEAYGDVAVDQFLAAILEDVKNFRPAQKIAMVTNFTTDCIFYTSEKHFPILKEILTYKDCSDIHAVCRTIADMEYKAFIPDIGRLYAYWLRKEQREGQTSFLSTATELSESFKALKTGKYEFEEYKKPHYQQWKHWEKHYDSYDKPQQKRGTVSPEMQEEAFHKLIMENNPGKDPNVAIQETLERFKNMAKPASPTQATHSSTKKVSRNAPCPCGSGKKYKRCCGKK